MIFLTEADMRYVDELEKFKNEVIICDAYNEDRFAGCIMKRYRIDTNR